jgi:hypothetical protein
MLADKKQNYYIRYKKYKLMDILPQFFFIKTIVVEIIINIR